MEELTYAIRETFCMAGYWFINLLIYIGIATLLWAPFVSFLLRKKKPSDKFTTFLFGSLAVLLIIAAAVSLLSFGKIGLIPYPF
ncbi:hypothetical protein IJM16_01905 [Candidatus Saccharibacteria bacterium]|nr:hypothetical protein [Candidatus Saccharibacteria bacterium]